MRASARCAAGHCFATVTWWLVGPLPQAASAPVRQASRAAVRSTTPPYRRRRLQRHLTLSAQWDETARQRPGDGSTVTGLDYAVRRVRAEARPVSAAPLGPWLIFACAALCIASVVLVGVSVSASEAFGRALLQLLVVATPFIAGLYARRVGADRRFASALLMVGAWWSVTALAQSSLSIPYTIGRLSTWVVFPSVFYLLLIFPDGRIGSRLDKVLLWGITGVIAVLFFGTAPLVAAFPVKTLWATCTTNCPPNAVFVLDRTPAFLTRVVYVREWLVELLWLGMFWSMLRRWRAASPLQLRATAPVFISG